MIACNLLAGPRLAVTEETWNTLLVKFVPEDHAAVFVAAVAPVLVNATDAEDGNAPG